MAYGCEHCQDDPLVPDRFLAPFLFVAPLDNLLVRLKFHDQGSLAPLLVALGWPIVDRTLRAYPVDCVLPMPLHPLRLLRRRYNQTALLAGELARRLQKPLDTHGLYRRRYTRPQTTLSAHARRSNVADAFAVDPGWAATHRQSTVLLVDDVMTTGSTLRAATAALKQAGIRHVLVCCMARVP